MNNIARRTDIIMTTSFSPPKKLGWSRRQIFWLLYQSLSWWSMVGYKNWPCM